ncbi:hypothetical protein [Nocardiopsis ansamitocini]|uniref:Cupin domain-containing protein n=1 Tax=Nocardiopsis ansamitocini TaxID=1670832 RepID=A0A9W6P515_9ACTN|nr:hypothetical protein [Nocardiopsis ansamitocini]GLU47340.1 hypothetical protein Nans01_16910 [Nocardiopsis ansamitocini]
MSYDISSPTRPASRTESPAAPGPRIDSAALADSLAGIGDIVMAGQRSAYDHLRTRTVPTVGQLMTAARGAAQSLLRPTLWPQRRGHWQLVPRVARRHARGRMRVTAVTLEPNGFVSLAAERGPGDPVPTSEVVQLVSGRAHTVVTGAAGQLLAVQELTPGRARVLGGEAGHQLLNTGVEPALVIRVSS